jgi:putative transposase
LFTAASSSFSNPIFRSGEDCRHFNFNSYPDISDNPTRLTLVLLSRWFNWQDALTIVRPKTFVTWHRKGFRLFWRWKSEAGRRPIPAELRRLIRR